MKDKPLPPDVLVSALQDKIDTPPERLRPAKAVRATPSVAELSWASTVVEQDAEGDVIGTAAKLLLKALRESEERIRQMTEIGVEVEEADRAVVEFTLNNWITIWRDRAEAAEASLKTARELLEEVLMFPGVLLWKRIRQFLDDK